MIDIWTERYRPEKLNDVVGQELVTERLAAFVKTRSLPHMLFAGSAGVGKTTAAIALAKELYDKDWQANFMETNASDERGIQVVRGKIKDFARTRPIGTDIDFKIIFLDESDALTPEAQQALRRTMERYTATTRFILSCIAGDTKITLSDEVEIKAAQLFSLGNKSFGGGIVSVTKTNAIENDLVLAVISSRPKNKRLCELATSSGRKIKLTADHRVLTPMGWKEAGKLELNDEVIVRPVLDSTPFEESHKNIVDFTAFQDFLRSIENPIKKRFLDLNVEEKEKVKHIALKLKNAIKQGYLTPRENEVLNLLTGDGPISRANIQEKIGLSRIRINGLLKSLEKKGFVNRIIKRPRTHEFIKTSKEPSTIANLRDIKKEIESKLGIKISYTTIRRIVTGEFSPKIRKTVAELEKRGLFALRYDDYKRAGALARLCGFLLGDGHLVKNRIRMYFSGNTDTLLDVKKDLDILGLRSSEINYKKITHELLGRKIVGTTTSMYCDSRAFSNLFEFFGVPLGDKVATPFVVPSWILSGTKFVKREFLRALFGCEGTMPRCKNKNFEAVYIVQHKIRDLEESANLFFTQLKTLLSDFDVSSYIEKRITFPRKKIKRKW